jgi:DedD protein
MEEGAKRRLVGTAVVVLLLVIFVPMVLDEKPREPLPDEDMQLPERPLQEPNVFPPPQATPGQPEPDSTQIPQELAVPPLPGAPAPSEPTPELDQQAAAPAQPEPPARTEASRPPPAPEVNEPPPPAGVSSWVLQVASLSDLQRARGLERDLRAKGFPAFIENARVDSKTFHRVRVGPEADRKRIEAMAASVKQKTGLAGQILHYP